MARPSISFKDKLHLSSSQITTYLNCSLKYYFSYCEALPPERVNIALSFGKAIHSSLEHFYLARKEDGELLPLQQVQDVFEADLTSELSSSNVPVEFNKSFPGQDSVVSLGMSMLKTYFDNQPVPDECEVVGVELPLEAPLFDENKKSLDLVLVGVIDLLVKDVKGKITAIDHKTLARIPSQHDLDQDLQLSAYSYLLASNKHHFPRGKTSCEYHVLKKTKQPKLEILTTTRSVKDRQRFAKVAAQVSRGVSQGIFAPTRSYFCPGCAYRDACRKW